MVAGGALNGTWRPQGGRAASPRPRGTQAALSRQPAGAKKLINSGFARERLNLQSKVESVESKVQSVESNLQSKVQGVESKVDAMAGNLAKSMQLLQPQ